MKRNLDEDRTLQIMPAPPGTRALFRGSDGKAWREAVHVLGLVEDEDGARHVQPMLPHYAETVLTPIGDNVSEYQRLEFPGPRILPAETDQNSNEGGKND